MIQNNYLAMGPGDHVWFNGQPAIIITTSHESAWICCEGVDKVILYMDTAVKSLMPRKRNQRR